MNTRRHRHYPVTYPLRDLLKLAAVCGLIAAVCLGGLFATGCGKQERALSTGEVVANAQLPSGFKGDAAYAVVRSDALPLLYENFRSVLSSQGLVKWDARYDCNHFAALYVALSQTQYAVAAWHSETKAQTLALAEVWFLRGGSGNKGHAIVQARTELGDIYIEPQSGARLTLTPAELRSIYLRKW